jgi:hypothetical protein
VGQHPAALLIHYGEDRRVDRRGNCRNIHPLSPTCLRCFR